MRSGAVVALATVAGLVVLAGCGLATSGLLDVSADLDAGQAPSSLPDASVHALDGGSNAAPQDASAPETAPDATDPSDAPPDAPTTVDAACPGPSSDASVGYATQVTKPPKIDGDLSDWGCAQRFTLTAANAAHVVTGGDVLTAEYSFAWDKDNLYVAAHVVDATPSGADPTDPWKNDSFAFFVSGDSPLTGDYDAFSHELFVDWHGLLVDYGNQRPSVKNPPRVSAKVKSVADGWTAEMAVGWQAVQAAAFVTGQSVAFDYSAIDGDGLTYKSYLLAIVTPSTPNCGCMSCCCGQQDQIDLPNCDTLTFGRLTLQ